MVIAFETFPPQTAVAIPNSNKVCVSFPPSIPANIPVIPCKEDVQNAIIEKNKKPAGTKVCGTWVGRDKDGKIVKKTECGNCPAGLQCITTTKDSKDKEIKDSVKDIKTQGGFCETSITEVKKVGDPCEGNLGLGCGPCLLCLETGLTIWIGIDKFGRAVYKPKKMCFLFSNGGKCEQGNQVGMCLIKNRNDVKCITECKTKDDCPPPVKGGRYCKKTTSPNGEVLESTVLRDYSFDCIKLKDGTKKCSPVMTYESSSNSIYTKPCKKSQKCVNIPRYDTDNARSPLADCK